MTEGPTAIYPSEQVLVFISTVVHPVQAHRPIKKLEITLFGWIYVRNKNVPELHHSGTIYNVFSLCVLL